MLHIRAPLFSFFLSEGQFTSTPLGSQTQMVSQREGRQRQWGCGQPWMPEKSTVPVTQDFWAGCPWHRCSRAHLFTLGRDRTPECRLRGKNQSRNCLGRRQGGGYGWDTLWSEKGPYLNSS